MYTSAFTFDHVTFTLTFTIGFYRLSRYMLEQNVIELSAAVHELSCWQGKRSRNNTVVATADNNK